MNREGQILYIRRTAWSPHPHHGKFFVIIFRLSFFILNIIFPVQDNCLQKTGRHVFLKIQENLSSRWSDQMGDWRLIKSLISTNNPIWSQNTMDQCEWTVIITVSNHNWQNEPRYFSEDGGKPGLSFDR